PAFVGVRQQHTDFTTETTVASAVSEGRFGGLALFQNERHYLLFGRTHDAVVAVRADGGAEMLASVPVGEADAAKPLTLRVLGSGGRCDLEYAWGDGPFAVLAQDVDTRCLSTHTARGFNGVIIGLYTGRLSPAALASGE
ncbi:MAG: glycoside hydrolase family 43 protein, partial [Alistipes sp.]|nr:glycoside hydrolase family 43 protein [Alistipes sp.]